MNEIVSNAAVELKDQYKLFLDALTGGFMTALEAIEPATPKARSAFDAATGRAVSQFYANYARMIERLFDQVKKQAIAEVEAEFAVDRETYRVVQEYTELLKEELLNEVKLCLQKDRNSVTEGMRKFCLKVMLKNDTVSKMTAIIGERHGAAQALQFRQTDTLGRRYQSQQFVFTLIREKLVDAYIETKVFMLAKSGIDVIEITNGETVTKVSITGHTPGMPNYLDLREAIFHPMSNADVRAFKE